MGHSDSDRFLDGDLAVNRRYGEISDEELIAAIDRLTFDHGDSRINGRPVVLKPVSWGTIFRGLDRGSKKVKNLVVLERSRG